MCVLLAAAILSMGSSMADQAQVESGEQIRVLPVPRTPESNTVILRVAVPENGEVMRNNPVWVQFRLDGYPLGTGSQTSRVDEVSISKMGQTVHVIVDDKPYFQINEPAIDPFNENGYYYDTSYKFELPHPLKEGEHTLRMFPARSYGESLKGDNTFHAIHFYLGEKKDQPGFNLNGPYLTYNEPGDQISLTENKPVLLDFLVSNCELTSDGYKVRLTIDGKMKRTLTSWQPYYIYGLRKGKHTIRLELIDSKGTVVPGRFNDVLRTIQIS